MQTLDNSSTGPFSHTLPWYLSGPCARPTFEFQGQPLVSSDRRRSDESLSGPGSIPNAAIVF